MSSILLPNRVFSQHILHYIRREWLSQCSSQHSESLSVVNKRLHASFQHLEPSSVDAPVATQEGAHLSTPGGTPASWYAQNSPSSVGCWLTTCSFHLWIHGGWACITLRVESQSLWINLLAKFSATWHTCCPVSQDPVSTQRDVTEDPIFVRCRQETYIQTDCTVYFMSGNVLLLQLISLTLSSALHKRQILFGSQWHAWWAQQWDTRHLSPGSFKLGWFPWVNACT